jgi:hypothetical protein
MDELDVDPGWRVSPGTLLLALVPGSAARGARRNDGLTVIRQVWLSFVVTVVVLGIVLLLIVPGSETSTLGPWLGAIAIATLGGLFLERRVSQRPLLCTDLTSLAGSYRVRFFMQAIAAETPCILAFVAAVVTGHWWLYWAVLPFGLLGFAHVAPTPSHLQQDQERLDTQGCGLSLVRALRTPTAAPTA